MKTNNTGLNGPRGLQAKLLASSMLVLTAASPAIAQESEEAETKTLDKIVVTGFRQSLANALASKRNADNVVDAISAEDIGKSADQNIAEALQRVTGIAINRADGEGTTVSARGAGPDLNNITLNGVTLTSSGDNQSVDLSQFSADVLAAIEVVKTPSADHDEGSLGAAINLKAFKPLSAKKGRRTFEVQSRYNDFASKDDLSLHDVFGGQDYKINGSFSEKFLNDTIGVSIVASTETQGGRRDEFFNTRYSPTTQNTRGMVNYETGELITAATGFDYDGSGTIEDDELTVRAHHNRQFRYNYRQTQRDRTTISSTLQRRPTDTTDIQFDMTYSDQDTATDSSYVSTGPQNNHSFSPEGVVFDPRTNSLLENVQVSFQGRADGNLSELAGQLAELNLLGTDAFLALGDTVTTRGGNRKVGVIRNHRDISSTNQKNLVIGGEIVQEWGDFTFNLRGGQSESEQKDNFWISGRFSVANSTANKHRNLISGYTCDPDDPSNCRLVWTPGIADDAESFGFNNIQLRDRGIKDKSQNLYFDVDWDRQFGPITSLETGLKWSKRTKDNRAFTAQFGNNETDGLVNAASGLTLADFSDDTSDVPSDWGDQLGFARDDITDGWATFNPALIQQYVEGLGTEINFVPNVRDTRQIINEAYGGYLKANLEMFDGALYGDFGVRVVTTDVTSSGFTAMAFNSQELTTFAENLAWAGYSEEDGVPLATNTRTRDEAIAAVTAEIGRDVFVGSTLGGVTAAVDPLAVTATHNYTNVLPSLNLNWAASDDIILRFATSKTMARPQIDFTMPNFTTNEPIFAANSTAAIGAPALDPYESTNLDFSAEWYFSEDSLFSVAFYNKDLKNAVENSQFGSYWVDHRDQFFDADGVVLPSDQITFVPTPENTLLSLGDGNNQANCMPERTVDLSNPRGEAGCDFMLVTQRRNIGSGYVRGIETSFQHNFTYLPSVLSGLGIQANYTYADSQTDGEILRDTAGNVVADIPNLPLIGTSKDTYNATVFWEQDGKLVRLAYNSRSDYLIDRSVADSYAHWIEGFDTLDLSASWKINPNVSLNFQGINLTDTVTRTYSTNVGDAVLPDDGSAFDSAPTSRTTRSNNTGSIYRIGLRFTW